MRFAPVHACHAIGNRQRGVALIILVVLLLIGVGAALFAFMRPASQAIERDKVTAAALAQAKAALIGYAVAWRLDIPGPTPRVGDFPCPDMNNDGTAGASCSNGGGTTLGRLPWKTLGLPDLRDGDGERLWYAVSTNFKNNPATSCVLPSDAGCLNSDSRGTITIRDSTGALINDGSNPDPYIPSGAIAVVISPGSVLQRQGTASPQDRSCTIGVNCDAAGKCTTAPPTLTPLCNAINYLDVLTATDDNSNFVDGSSADGFINGRILDASNNIIVNDRLLTITYQDLMPLMERRVAKETFNCLSAYALDAQNNGRYPWAADIVLSGGGDYSDVTDKRAGRIPDSFTNTVSSSSSVMKNGWTPSCNIPIGTWWINWKELVFYAVADAFKPVPGTPPPAPVCGNCLTVTVPAVTGQVQMVVIVAGKKLAAVAGGQPRSTASDKGTPANYLEGDNDWLAIGPFTPDGFTKQPAGTSFNDYLLFQ
jgi:hypothetical protein